MNRWTILYNIFNTQKIVWTIFEQCYFVTFRGEWETGKELLRDVTT